MRIAVLVRVSTSWSSIHLGTMLTSLANLYSLIACCAWLSPSHILLLYMFDSSSTVPLSLSPAHPCDAFICPSIDTMVIRSIEPSLFMPAYLFFSSPRRTIPTTLLSSAFTSSSATNDHLHSISLPCLHSSSSDCVPSLCLCPCSRPWLFLCAQKKHITLD